MTADAVGRGHCQDCGGTNREVFKDLSDGGLYCKECWVHYYGALPLRHNAAPRGFAGSQAGDKQDEPSCDNMDLLPEDAPRGHVAHTGVKYAAGKQAYCFRWQSAGQSIHFQTTVPAAGGSRTAAAVIARSCYMKFAQGWTKDRVREFRNQCYAKLGGRMLPSSQASQKNFGQGARNMRMEMQSDCHSRASKAADLPRTASNQAERSKARPLVEPLHPSKRQRTSEEPCSPIKLRQPGCSNSKQRGGGQAFLQPTDLKLLLDDPQASLPPKAEVRSIRSQGLASSQASQLASQADSWLGQEEKRRPATGDEDRQYLRCMGRSGSGPFAGCCGCCCRAQCGGSAALGPRRQVLAALAGNNSGTTGEQRGPHQQENKVEDAKLVTETRNMAPRKRPMDDSDDSQEESVNSKTAKGTDGGLQKIKESMDEESLPPESQHRPESQPTPFCWDPPIVTKIQVSAPDSVPTPHAEEPIAWPALQSIPVPPVVSESVPTPWFSQPTPKVEMSDVRYISDPTPLPPTREEEALPSSSLPTPVPAEAAPRNVDSGDQTAARADAAAGCAEVSETLADEEAARQPQESPFATSLDVVSLPPSATQPAVKATQAVLRKDSQAAATHAQLPSVVPKAPMAKPESSFAAMLLQRSRAAAATRAEVQRAPKTELPAPVPQLRKGLPIERETGTVMEKAPDEQAPESTHPPRQEEAASGQRAATPELWHPASPELRRARATI